MNYPQTVTAPVGVIHVETGYGPARFWGIAFNSTAPDVPKDLVNIVGAKNALKNRTAARMARGVEGTHTI
jgi:hypothetical protein